MNAIPSPLWSVTLALDGYTIVNVTGALPSVLAALESALAPLNEAGVHPSSRLELKLQGGIK